MIEYKTGNLLAEEVDAVFNAVNCVGVMGRGIALQFKRAFPENFGAYAGACRQGVVSYPAGGQNSPQGRSLIVSLVTVLDKGHKLTTTSVRPASPSGDVV